MLWTPIEEKAKKTIRQGYREQHVWDALQWRTGNEFYSFVREVYTVSYLRTADKDVRVHPLADALFRVDAWLRRTVLDVYVRNDEYRDGKGGRKLPSEVILAGADPAFKFVELPLPEASEFGRIYLPPERELKKVLLQLNS